MRPVKPSSLPPESCTLTVSGVATGGALLATALDNVVTSYVTVAVEDANTAAANFGAAIAAAMPAYTVTVVGPAITVTGAAFIWLVASVSTDATQSVAASGFIPDTSVLYEATVAGSGQPGDAGDGWGIPCAPRQRDQDRNLYVKVRLLSVAGGAKTARYKVWGFYQDLGWSPIQAVGTAGLASVAVAAGPGYTMTITPVAIPGVQRVAVELEDDGAGGNLANCLFSAWLSYAE